MDSNVVKWLFLPDHLTPPNPFFLLCKISMRNNDDDDDDDEGFIASTMYNKHSNKSVEDIEPH